MNVYVIVFKILHFRLLITKPYFVPLKILLEYIISISCMIVYDYLNKRYETTSYAKTFLFHFSPLKGRFYVHVNNKKLNNHLEEHKVSGSFTKRIRKMCVKRDIYF